jgi:protein involved in polysaccharide export with SLBB domain
LKLGRKVCVLMMVLLLYFQPLCVYGQNDKINQVNNLLLNSQQFVGSIPVQKSTGGRIIQQGERSASFKTGESRTGRGISGGTNGDGEMTGEGWMNLSYQVHLLGAVSKRGTYRIPASTRLAEAIQMAGGFDTRASQRVIEVRRLGQRTRTYDLYSYLFLGDLNQNPYLTDNDVVYVPLNKGIVQVTGAVQRPGEYELHRESNLYEIIDLAGGYTKGILKSRPIKVIRFKEGEKDLIDVVNSSRELKEFKVAVGDVYYVPQLLTQGVKFDYNITEIPGDTLFLPSYDDQVYVLGGVSAPGPTPFVTFFKAEQYIAAVGGFTHLAKRKKISIISQSGNTKVASAKNDLQINPGDTIIVDEKRMDPLGWVQFTMGLATFSLSIISTILVLK